MKKSKKLSGIKKVCLFILMSALTWTASAGVVKGVIRDKQSKEPLAGATVIVSGSNDGTAADGDGVYKLELPAGTYTMTVRYIGYKNIVKKM